MRRPFANKHDARYWTQQIKHVILHEAGPNGIRVVSVCIARSVFTLTSSNVVHPTTTTAKRFRLGRGRHLSKQWARPKVLASSATG